MADERYVGHDTVTAVVQIKGKVRAKLEVPVDIDPADLEKQALAAVAAPDMKAPTIKDMEGWLLGERLIAMEKLPTKGFYYVPTPAGVDAGLRSEDRVSARGTPYSVLQFTPPAQKLIVEHYIKK